MDIVAPFGLGQTVYFLDNDELPITITAIVIAEDGIRYEIAWFSHGERKTARVYPKEIKCKEPKEMHIGFRCSRCKD